jgi:hypothetical protein
VDDTFIDGLNWSMSHQKTGGVSQHGAVQVRVLTQKGDKTARNQDAVALLSSSIEHVPPLIPYLSWSSLELSQHNLADFEHVADSQRRQRQSRRLFFFRGGTVLSQSLEVKFS